MRNLESTTAGSELIQIPHAAPGRRKAFGKTGAHPSLAGDYALEVGGEMIVVNGQYTGGRQNILALCEESILIKPVQRRSHGNQIELSGVEIELLSDSETIAYVGARRSMIQHILRRINGDYLSADRGERDGRLS
jgi:hypothetical protein